MSSLLITGGAGFIGSHVCHALIQNGYDLYIIDNLKNSTSKSINILENLDKNKNRKIIKFFEGDIKNDSSLREIFNIAKNNNSPIESVLHLASLKQIKESIIKPIMYWDNNLTGTISLLKIMQEFDCKQIVFSSSATVYSSKCLSPIGEDSEISPVNTYGHTKASIEKLLQNLTNNKEGWKVVILRYFNPIGAHKSGLIGESPLGIPSNLFPIICRVASNSKKFLNIYGKDWNTHDGTCIRDYIHIMDIAEGHLSAIKYLMHNAKSNTFESFNLGTGEGTSVLQLIRTFEKVTNCEIPIRYTDRRMEIME